MRIQHNIAALNSYRQLTSNNNAVAKNLEKLSSGYRINRAGDDAAGLAISEKMRAQISGLDMATKNAQDGISLIQTGEGALQESHSILQRMRELAVQSSNGIYDNETDRANLDKEITALKSELDRISTATDFNGIKLLDGSQAAGAVKGVTVGDLTAGTDVKATNDITIKDTFFKGTDTGIEVGSKQIEQEVIDPDAVDTVQTTAAAGADVTVSVGTLTGDPKGVGASTTMEFNPGDLAKLAGAAAAGSTVAQIDGDFGKLEGMEITIMGQNSEQKFIVTFDKAKANEGSNYLDLSAIAADDTATFTNIEDALGEALAKAVTNASKDANGSLAGIKATYDAATDKFKLENTNQTATLSAPMIRFNEASKAAANTLRILDGASDSEKFQNGTTITFDDKSFVFTKDATLEDDDAKGIYYINLDKIGSNGNAGAGSMNKAPTDDQLAAALYNKIISVDAGYKDGSGDSGIKIEMAGTAGTGLAFIDTKDPNHIVEIETTVSKGNNVASTLDFTANSGAADKLYGSTITINDGQGHEKTFEFVEAGKAVKEGNIGVVLASNANAASIAQQLETMAKAQGFDIAASTNGTVEIGANGFNAVAWSEITSGDQKTTTDIDLKDTSKYQVGSTFTIKGENGDTVFEFVKAGEKTAKTSGAVAVEFSNMSSANAANLLKAIQEQGGKDNKLTAQERAAFSATGSVVSADKAKFDGKITTGGAAIQALTAESRTFTLNTSLKEGTVLDVNGQKFEFSYDGEAADGNTAVKISPNSTAQEISQAFVDAYNAANQETATADKYTAELVTNSNGGYDVKLTAAEAGAKDVNVSILSSNNGEEGITFQIGANGAADQRVSLQIDDMSTEGLNLSDVSIATQEEANASIDKIDAAINKVSGTRADLGALQNRMEHTINNLSVNSENLTAAESRIRDVDVAKEMMAFTKNNILVQSAQAMLAQANQIPQGVLQLLG